MHDSAVFILIETKAIQAVCANSSLRLILTFVRTSGRVDNDGRKSGNQAIKFKYYESPYGGREGW